MLGEAGLFNPLELPDLIEETLDNLANTPLGELADMLGDGGSNQQKRADRIKEWLALDDGRKPSGLGHLVRLF